MDDLIEEKEYIVEEESHDELIEQNNTGSPKKSAKKNYFYNMLYQVFALIVPLIVTPYISRVLGSDGVGEYSFTYSLITYFVLFGAFGFGYYAQREIARYQNDKYTQSCIFWEILICRLLTVVVALLINNIFIFTGIYGKYTILMAVFNINIVATMIDVAFFYQGNEEFKTIAIVNVIFKALGVVSIFLFVKNESHVWVYTLCNCAIMLGSNVLLCFIIPRKIVKIDIKKLNVFRHFVPSLRLFIPTIAVSIYTMLDRTLIGLIVTGETEKTLVDGTVKMVKNSDIQNGYYEQSEKIVKMALTVLTSLGAVMIPKNSFYFKSGNIEKVKENIIKACHFVFIIGMPIMFGLMSTASNFSPWFFGPDYDDVPLLIMIFSPLIMSLGLNNVFGIQYLLPAGKDRVYAYSVLFGAIINLVLNLILIRFYGALGAAVASVIAETVILIFQMIYLRKQFNYRALVLPFIKYFVVGGLMFACVYTLNIYVFESSIINSLILVLIGVFVYFGLLLVLRDKFVLGFSKRIMFYTKKILKRND